MNLKSNINNIGYIFKISINNMKLSLVFNFIYTIVMGMLPILILQVNKRIMNIVETKPSEYYSGLILLVFLILIMNILQILISNINSAIIYLNSIVFGRKFEINIFKKLSRINVSYYDSFYFRELFNKIYAGSNLDYFHLISLVFNILQSVIVIISFIFALWHANIYVEKKIIIISGSIFALIYRRYFFNKQNKLSLISFEETNLYERQNKTFNEIFLETKVQDELKVYSAQKYFIEHIKQITTKLYEKKKVLQYKIHNLNRIGAIGVYIIQKIIYIILLYDIYNHIIPYGNFVLIVGILEGFFSEIIKINLNFSSLWENLHYINYIREFYGLNDDMHSEQSTNRKETKNIDTIEFKDVYFKYPDTNNYILSGVNFKIDKGQRVGIIGVNGSGKSTILKLLMRLYDVERGNILINGVDIKEYDIEFLYSQFSAVFQDFCKYALTIREFIIFDEIHSKDTSQRINDALESVQMKTFVDNLPKGTETLLTKNFTGDSTDLSTGQWQKLSLARAFYNDRQVIVLDEPTAFLDVISERKILKSLHTKMREKTIIMITHNLSITNNYDNIILIDKGLVVAQGKHKVLIANSQLYKTMYNNQAHKFAK